MAVEPFFMVACEVGLAGSEADRPLVIGQLSKDGIQVNLTKPGSFGTVEHLLNEYGIGTKDLPTYVKDALKLEATIQKLDYKSKRVATFNKNALKDIKPLPGRSLEPELVDARVVIDGTGDKERFSVVAKNNDKLTNFDVSKTDSKGEEYSIGKVTYTFVITARYESAWPVVPGMLGMKFLAFAITNDEKKEAALQQQIEPILTKSLGGQPVMDAKPAVPAQR